MISESKFVNRKVNSIHNSRFTIHDFTNKLGYVEGVVDFGSGGVRIVV